MEKVELTELERLFILKCVEEYWLVYNEEHEDNTKDYEITKQIINKIEFKS